MERPHQESEDRLDEEDDELIPDTPRLVAEVEEAVANNNPSIVRNLIQELEPVELSDLLSQLAKPEREAVIELIREDFDPELLPFLYDTVRDEVIDSLEHSELAEAIAELDHDDAVDLLEDMEDEDQQAILKAISAEDRAAFEDSLNYPDDSAGRMMRRDPMAVPSFWTVGQMIDYLRETPDLPDEFYEIFVVDIAHRPIGTLPLSRVLRAKRPLRVADLMDEDQKLIPVDTDQEEVAYLFQQYDLLSAAVVDEVGRLVGVITIDDIVDIVVEETEEDMMLLAGVSNSDLNESVIATMQSRIAWLAVNLLTGVVVSSVISIFDAAIEQVVALAVLMPIVASMGGNAGTQTMAVAVRALATKDLTTANAFRIVRKEMLVGLANGVILASLVGLVVGVIFQNPILGGVMAGAIVCNLVVAGFAGSMVPLMLEKFGADPAVASSVFLTMITDSVGFFAFLSLGFFFLL